MTEATVETENIHPLYTDRENKTITIRGDSMPGWFTGQAAIWTGGSAPKIIGPFESCKDAMLWQADHAPGSQIFPYYEPI